MKIQHKYIKIFEQGVEMGIIGRNYNSCLIGRQFLKNFELKRMWDYMNYKKQVIIDV